MDKKRINKIERIYEDDDWVIDKIGDEIRISLFEDYHFKEEFYISKEMMLSDLLDEFKNSFYEYKLNKGEM